MKDSSILINNIIPLSAYSICLMLTCRTATAQVILQASDVNDHSPVFEQLEYHVAVSESELLNSRFLQVTATDEDLGW